MPTPGYDYQTWMTAEVNALDKAVTAKVSTRSTCDRQATSLRTRENVGVRLGGRQILSGVSFAVAPGQFTGLIGPNGAGKTTLLRVILGLTPPTEGRVLLNGSPRTRHGGGLIGYVPQKLAIDQDMPLRARDVVGLGIDGNRLGFPLPSASRGRRITEALEAVGAERYADARVGELSGGEQQRVLIAHALISRPKLLLLDEPLANLDLRSEQGIVSVLARLAHEQGIAVLISAHDLNPLLREIDTRRLRRRGPGGRRARPTRSSSPTCSAPCTAAASTCCTCTAGCW